MASYGAIIDLIQNTTDQNTLLSLITPELFQNYKSYLRSGIESTTYDYTSLATKITYDAFLNSYSSSTSNNILTEIFRTKQCITYVKQYAGSGLNNHIYSYRITSVTTPVTAQGDATSTALPAPLTDDLHIVEQTFTMNALKTTRKQTFIANTVDDFLLMPAWFAKLSSPFSPSPSVSHYALRSMLIDYYSGYLDPSLSMITKLLIGSSLVLGVGVMMFNYNLTRLLRFVVTTLLPIVLYFGLRYDTASTSQESINVNKSFKDYLILSGSLGCISSMIDIGMSVSS